jgi:hypothetical protein
MLHKIPKSESLYNTMQRSSVYWDNVISPALREGKTIFIVGHENNLRSLIMRLENISPDDIINLNLPRAVPLAYRLDLNTLQPMNIRKDGSLDSATGFLRGEWLGGDDSVSEILSRDHKQVYDTTITANLEIGSATSNQNGKQWMKVVNDLSEIPPGAKALGNEAAGSFLGTAPVVTSSIHDPICQRNGHLLSSTSNLHPAHQQQLVNGASIVNGATTTSTPMLPSNTNTRQVTA